MRTPLPETTELAELAPAETSSEAKDTETFSFLEILITLARKKRLILFSTFGCGILATALSYTQHPQFTAVTTLLPPQQAAGSSAALLSQIGNLGALGSVGAGSLGIKNTSDTYIALMRSETVENAVIRRFELLQEYDVKLMSFARRMLESAVKIDAGAKDGLIRIAVTDRSATRAAEIANGYVEEYRKLSSQLAITEAGQRRLFFEQQLDAQKDKLAAAEEILKETAQTTGVVEMDSQARALIQSAGSLRAQIAAKEVQIASMRTYAASGNIDLQQAEQELSSLRGELNKLGGSESGNDMMVSKGRLPQVGLNYARKLRDVKYNETLFEILARQFEAAKLDEAKEGVPLQIVDMASVPDRKSFPPRPSFLLVGLIVGSLGSCLRVVLRAGLEEDAAARNRWMALKSALLGRTEHSK